MTDIELLFSRIEEYRCQRMQSRLASIPACPGLKAGPHESDIRHQEEIDEGRKFAMKSIAQRGKLKMFEVYCQETGIIFCRTESYPHAQGVLTHLILNDKLPALRVLDTFELEAIELEDV